ncbi:sulfate adenylyltransferase subunit 1 [Streptomyces gamaensis]|uniref:sulfate adenylyltransferase n=1 Tax=Streptomyces gamaensis TaxID=1763542 RepID=A0ABW0YXU6_9ACTN
MPTPTPQPPASLLRFATAGSVDDGKSTLVGRLLHDTRTVLADQLAALPHTTNTTTANGNGIPDLALLTDGLRAEREQGITIDVAHRYFATPRRRFVLADTPGHLQYTRNMVTGASTAHLALLLVDARHGIVEQTRRHTALAALLRVPHLTLAVNKMDLTGHREDVFTRITADFTATTTALGIPHTTAIPVSALNGDNIVTPSPRMPWYTGPTVLEHLETVPLTHHLAHQPARFPVQYVIRPQTPTHPDYRGYAGQLTTGTLHTGQPVTVLPSGHTTTIAAIDALGHRATTAHAPQSLTLRLTDHLDISRGDLIVPTGQEPPLTRDIHATVCHLTDQPLHPGHRVLLKHTTRTVKAIVKHLTTRLDPHTLTHHPNPPHLNPNDIAHIHLHTSEPLPLDPYTTSRHTGSFLLIDPTDGTTLTAGMADSGHR